MRALLGLALLAIVVAAGTLAVLLVDRSGRLLYPATGAAPETAAVEALRAEVPDAFWERGGRRHVIVGDQLFVITVVKTFRGQALPGRGQPGPGGAPPASAGACARRGGRRHPHRRPGSPGTPGLQSGDRPARGPIAGSTTASSRARASGCHGSSTTCSSSHESKAGAC